MPRVGLAWDPFGDAQTMVRPATASSTMASPTAPEVRCRPPSARCRGPRRINCPAPDSIIANPYGGGPRRSARNNFVAPATVLTVQSGMLPPYSQNWNLSIERVIAKDYLLDVRYVGNKGTHLPRFIEANPTILRTGRQRE
jgi:hypothetical protein